MDAAVVEEFSEALREIHQSRASAEVEAALEAAQGRIRARSANLSLGDETATLLLNLMAEHASARHATLRARALPAGRNEIDAFLSLRALRLTRRECEVLGWIVAGKRDAEIAAILGISARTVGKHIEHVLAKLSVETRTAAANVARRWLVEHPAFPETGLPQSPAASAPPLRRPGSC